MQPTRPWLETALAAPYAMVLYPLIALRRATSTFRPGRPWRTWVTEQVLVGGFLRSADVPELVRQGVTGVINVSVELLDPTTELGAAGIEYLRVPCWDTRSPSLAAAHGALEWMHRHLSSGGRVYVHCASGVGRSVTLTACYLAVHQGLDPDSAIQWIAARRPRVAMRANQRAFVSSYLEWRTVISAPAQGGEVGEPERSAEP